MLLMIDNYDSFTYNLVQYLQSLGAEVRVERNDALTVDEIERLAPQRIVISPGPCTPNEAGVSMAVIERLGASTPILGACQVCHAAGWAAKSGDPVLFTGKDALPAATKQALRRH